MLMRYCFVALVFPSVAMAADFVVNVQPQQVYAHCVSGPDPQCKSTVWFDLGFGRPDHSAGQQQHEWNLSGTAYVLFRSNDAYWTCQQSRWDTYIANQDEPALLTNSVRFSWFNRMPDYQIPDLDEPVTWQVITDHLTVGHLTDTTIVIVTATSGYQWAVRGATNTNWQQVSTIDEGKVAALQLLGG